MKKLLFLFAILVSSLSFAQIKKNSAYVGVSSNSVTGINYQSVEKSKAKTFNVGLQGGYFVIDNLAAIAGVGYNLNKYGGNVVSEAISYQFGGKYYIANVLPLQADFNGVEDVNYIGTQLGYAWFPSKNFSIEPNVRYDFALKNYYENKFSFGVGFNYFFNRK